MPGWHAATKELQDRGNLQVVGIIQEQHPDRCRLFMQWQQMEWPILVDSLDLMGVSGVPITLAIDEQGIIRGKNLRPRDARNVLQLFGSVAASAGVQSAAAVPPSVPDLPQLQQAAASGEVAALHRYARSLVLWGGASRLDDAIAAYETALRSKDHDGPENFRLGVAYRMRYDSDYRRSGDFRQAVKHWKRALDIDPNQYIWRRRIQQYGPRLDKPYSFYDWIHTARRDILARGDVPQLLRVEPGDAEFAYPQPDFPPAEAASQPDPQGRIARDPGKLIHVETTVVPTIVEPGQAMRVHLVFRPSPTAKAHWNNEAEPLRVWLSPPPDWQVDRHLLNAAGPPEAVSSEPRRLGFELRCPKAALAGIARVPAYAVYYVCEDERGECLYRRQELEIPVQVRVQRAARRGP